VKEAQSRSDSFGCAVEDRARIFDVLANNFSVLPGQYLRTWCRWLCKKPIGAGIHVVEWVKDDHLTLEANPTLLGRQLQGQTQARRSSCDP